MRRDERLCLMPSAEPVNPIGLAVSRPSAKASVAHEDRNCLQQTSGPERQAGSGGDPRGDRPSRRVHDHPRYGRKPFEMLDALSLPRPE